MPKKRKTNSPLRHSGKRKAHPESRNTDSGQARMTGNRFFTTFRMTIKGFLSTSSFRTKSLLIIGFILVSIPTFFYINEGVQLAFFTPKVPVVAKQFAAPTAISIPSVQMQLPIAETAIVNGAWGIAQDGISHLNISARPGEVGPIILYGHNTNDRFGPIRWLTKDAEITLVTSDGKEHKYRVAQTQDVSPNQVSVLLNQKGETLILYTCDGFADLQRFVVIAKPVN